MGDVAQRLQGIRERIAAACADAGRAAGEVQLVAVSKMQPLERVREAYACGQRDFGENYVQGLEQRREELPDDIRWHFIGHLQRNKAAKVVDAALIHTVDSPRLAHHLSKLARARQLTPAVLIQVNISADPNKHGVAEAELFGLLETLCSEDALDLQGLMCIPDASVEPRREFARMRELHERAVAATGRPLPQLSMGMSGDFEDAIREGSTLVRVGTAVFGPRQT